MCKKTYRTEVGYRLFAHGCQNSEHSNSYPRSWPVCVKRVHILDQVRIVMKYIRPLFNMVRLHFSVSRTGGCTSASNWANQPRPFPGCFPKIDRSAFLLVGLCAPPLILGFSAASAQGHGIAGGICCTVRRCPLFGWCSGWRKVVSTLSYENDESSARNGGFATTAVL